jgi:hypothetical protein
LHNGRPQNRFRDPDVPGGNNCRVGIGVDIYDEIIIAQGGRNARVWGIKLSKIKN